MTTSLLVMRLKDMHRVHPRQDDSKVCARCGHRVGIYPSGQQVLKQDPSVEIVCSVCMEQDSRRPDVIMPAPGALAEPAQSRNRKEGK